MLALDEMEVRARRHLDGMTVNRDTMARDVIILVTAIRELQSKAEKEKKADEYSGDIGADLVSMILSRRK